MKKIILLIMFITSFCAQAGNGSAVSSPESIVGKSLDLKFATHLKEGKESDLDKFYESTREDLVLKSGKFRKEKTIEDLNFLMWSYYYILNTPLHEVEKIVFGVNCDEDISARSTVIQSIRLDWEDILNLAKKNKLKENDLRHLLAEYVVSSMKAMKGLYNPDLFEIVRQKEEEYKKIEREDFCDHFNFATGILTESPKMKEIRLLNLTRRRSDYAKSHVEFKESYFVETLLELFPGKSYEIKKYFQMAGYATNEEIWSLLDRTVGREKKVEFLYKGRKEEKPSVSKPKKNKKENK